MGLLGRILDKLGVGDDDAAGKTSASSSTATATRTRRTPPPAATPRSVPVVDVVAKLDERAAAIPQKLNWQTSIVDLLKLLDVDSSLDSRKELARELGAPEQVMGDSATMNTWLHKAVLGRIAANGGNVPGNLYD